MRNAWVQTTFAYLPVIKEALDNYLVNAEKNESFRSPLVWPSTSGFSLNPDGKPTRLKLFLECLFSLKLLRAPKRTHRTSDTGK